MFLLGTFITAHEFIMVNNKGVRGALIIYLPGGKCQTAFMCFALNWFSNMCNSHWEVAMYQADGICIMSKCQRQSVKP